jgi:glycosyltransferase involved in cell wall biosynthesis
MARSTTMDCKCMKLKSQLHIGIDASNIKQGGGLTHLSKLLLASDPTKMGFNQVTIWSSKSTADKLPDRDWINKKNPSWMEFSYPKRMLHQFIRMSKEVKVSKCDVLFAPGGILSPFLSIPSITMSQNLLPFETTESSRFGKYSVMHMKFRVLKIVQKLSFKNADGVIFLTDYARKVVSNSLKSPLKSTTIISHGIEKRFINLSNLQKEILPKQIPIKLLYISILMPYKHQCSIAKAVYQLKKEGIPVEITFVGAAYGNYGKKFLKLINQLDPKQEFIHWVDEQSFEVIHQYYKNADIFVFASSCENLPNILIEAMASGLPIACANKGPMPDVLGDAGVYFDPDISQSISDAIRKLLLSPNLRKNLGNLAQQKGKLYSWENCAHKTFEFIENTVHNRRIIKV